MLLIVIEISLTEWAVVARHFTRWTATFIRHSTYSTHILFVVRVVLFRSASIPAPVCYCVPMFDGDLHLEKNV